MTESINYTKPILKWVGGKTQIIDKVINEFPKEINNYHEIFLGGGSVLIALLENINNNNIKLKGKIYAYDLNETLINMYKNIKDNYSNIFKEIKELIKDYNDIKKISISKKDKKIDSNNINKEDKLKSKEYFYYWVRYEFNNMKQKQKNSFKGSAYFIFLNKTCFRGLYREGPNGFNVPFGNYDNPEILNEEHLKKISNLIKDVEFIHSDFDESMYFINKDDFTYLDPPYAPENNKSFVGYTDRGFDIDSHLKLFKLTKKYKFLMSNADVKLVRDNFNDRKYIIKTILCKRSINSKKPDSKTNEVLIKSIN
jgi:DNA adenine methylase